MSEAFNSFIAGVLYHYKALLPLMNTHPNSLKRLVPGCWAGSYISWGIDNKETPIRVVAPFGLSGQVTNAEFKSFDGITNHYLALAGLIACGISGLKQNIKLPKPCDGDPVLKDEDTRRSMGISPIPTKFSERKAELMGELGKPIRDMLG